MSIVIVGGGFAGLTSAIKLKHTSPGEDIVVIEKRFPQSNTQIAGMRIRAGITGKREDSSDEIAQLLASRNNGNVTEQMKLFADTAASELAYWLSPEMGLNFEDRPEWFGPKWGTANRAGYGYGMSALLRLKKMAQDRGVVFYEGEARGVMLDNNHVEGISVHTKKDGNLLISADKYVLAGGSISGRMFLSTNKNISYSPQELAYDAGLSLVDSTVHMIHPFGNCDSQGNPLIGCYETDNLVGVKVYLDGTLDKPIFDEETTELLQEHQAHYQFPQLAKRFRDHGSVVMLQFPDGEKRFARVSHHYGHIGIETSDGIQASGVDNLYAAGDASGLGYWTNHKERLPGFALLKCLVDAELLAQTNRIPPKESEVRFYQLSENEPESSLKGNAYGELIKKTNSQYLDMWLTAGNDLAKSEVGRSWKNTLIELDPDTENSILHNISIGTAYAHWKVGQNKEVEPLKLNRDLVNSIIQESTYEVRAEINRKERF